MTPKQESVFLFLKNYRSKYGRSPTLREIQDGLEFASLNSIAFLLNQLEKDGHIVRLKGTDRGVIPTGQENTSTVNIPVVGSVACGVPLLAQENTEGYIPVDRRLIRGSAENHFFLHAVGDSMNEAGINSGDLVLVKSQSVAEDGDQVVALIDDSATIKILKKYDDHIALVPHSSNPANRPIILHNDFTIQGIVQAVYKKDMLSA